MDLSGKLYKILRMMRALKQGACRLRRSGAAANDAENSVKGCRFLPPFPHGVRGYCWTIEKPQLQMVD